MLKVEIFCRAEEIERLREALKKNNYPYYYETFMAEGAKGRIYHVIALVPDEALDAFMQEVTKAIDLRRGENSIIVTKAEAGISQKYERLAKSLTKEVKVSKSPAEVLLEEARAHAKVDIPKVTLAGIASIIALTGLLTDNPVLVIAAMLLSPILGPLYGFTINVVLGKASWAASSLYSLLKLLVSIFVTAFTITLILTQAIGIQIEATKEIMLRANPSLPYLGIAALLGYAGMVAIVKKLSETLAGVAIAVALVPPLTVFGTALGAGWASIASGSLVLTLENIVGLLLGSLIAAHTLGISPRRYYERKTAKHHIIRTLFVLVALIIFIAVLELIK